MAFDQQNFNITMMEAFNLALRSYKAKYEIKTSDREPVVASIVATGCPTCEIVYFIELDILEIGFLNCNIRKTADLEDESIEACRHIKRALTAFGKWLNMCLDTVETGL